jgi:catechol 2,3-dioxygenase-like lactoylglutathione lyase family enzyme
MDERDEVPVLPVSDVPRAVAALRDVLGLEVVEDLGWMATVGDGDGALVRVVADAVLAATADDGGPAVIRVA